MSNGGMPFPDFQPPQPMYGRREEQEYQQLRSKEGFWPSLMGQMAKNLTIMANPRMYEMLEMQDQQEEQRKRQLEQIQYEDQTRATAAKAAYEQQKREFLMQKEMQERDEYGQILNSLIRTQQPKQAMPVPYAGAGSADLSYEAYQQGGPSALMEGFEPEMTQRGNMSVMEMLRNAPTEEARQSILTDAAAYAKAQQKPGSDPKSLKQIEAESRARTKGTISGTRDEGKYLFDEYKKEVKRIIDFGDAENSAEAHPIAIMNLSIRMRKTPEQRAIMEQVIQEWLLKEER